MNISFKKLIVPALAAVSVLLVPVVRASYNCSLNNATYYRGGYAPASSGGLICQYDRYGGSYGDLKDSYSCSSTLDCVKYSGGDAVEGQCLVLQDKWGGCYVWNICDWNGTDQIDCDYNRNVDCSKIEIYGDCKSRPPCNPPPTCVPEPTTVLAGALLLVPLGVQTVRQLSRRQKPARI